MRGAIGLLAIAAVVYVFWLTYVFIKRTENSNNTNKAQSKNKRK